MKVNLFLEKEGLEIHASRVTGPIWIEIGDYAFPAKGWDDFPLVLLNWWIDSAASGAKSMSFDFMDGPYRYDVKDCADGLDIIFYAGDKEVRRERVEMSAMELLDTFRREAASIADYLTIKNAQIEGNDFPSLKKKIGRAQ